MTTTTPTASELARLDAAGPTRCQFKIMFISGMGFFADAYDLFVIGTVVVILRPEWHLSATQVSLLSSTALAASAIGAIVFGRLADILGRKRMYGVEVLILAAGAIASALAPSFVWLIAFRVVLGIGIGGDYPVSSTMMSEYAGRRTRGRMVGLVFSMQAAGLVCAPLVAVALLETGLSHDLVWRLLLGLGAVPGLSVYRLRRQIHETPRFALAGGAADEARTAIAQATGEAPVPRERLPESAARGRQSFLEGFAALMGRPQLLKWLIGGAGAWFLLDFAYYGNTIASPQIITLLSPRASLVHLTLLNLLIFVVAAVPGYAAAVLLIDRLGRRPLQSGGFAVMAAMFVLIGVVPGVTTSVVPFIVLFGVSYFFTEFGPNTTTFVYPSEMFPLEVRTSGHGLCAAMGKLGAFTGTYLFPTLLTSWGIRGTEVLAGAVALGGLVVTQSLLPETKGESLEALSAHGQAGFAPLPVRA